jgi:Uma2 family endonuclease
MSALPKPFTPEEFVDWEERQELRYEFDGFAAQAMTGGTLAHSAIQTNLLGALSSRLRGTPCCPHGSELKVRTATTIRYPDALVTCSRGDPRSTFAPDPVVIFEILSPSSAGQDLGAKNVEYQTLPSLKRYVVLHQSLAAAEVFHRADGEWTHVFVTAEGALDMPEIEARIPLDEIYEEVEFAT